MKEKFELKDKKNLHCNYSQDFLCTNKIHFYYRLLFYIFIMVMETKRQMNCIFVCIEISAKSIEALQKKFFWNFDEKLIGMFSIYRFHVCTVHLYKSFMAFRSTRLSLISMYDGNENYYFYDLSMWFGW